MAKKVKVSGHFRTTNGKRVYVRPHVRPQVRSLKGPSAKKKGISRLGPRNRDRCDNRQNSYYFCQYVSAQEVSAQEVSVQETSDQEASKKKTQKTKSMRVVARLLGP